MTRAGIWKQYLRKPPPKIVIEDEPIDSEEAKEKELDEKRYINLPEELRHAHEKVFNRIIALDSEPVDEWKIVEDSDGLKGWTKEGAKVDGQPIIKTEYILPHHFSHVLSFIWDINSQYVIYPGVERMYLPVSYNDRTSTSFRVTKSTWPFEARQVCTSGAFRVHKGHKMIFYGFSHDLVKKMFSKFINDKMPFTEFEFSCSIFEPMEGNRTKVVRIIQTELNGLIPNFNFVAEMMRKKSIHSVEKFAEELAKYSTNVPVSHTFKECNEDVYLDEDSILKEFSTWRVSANPLEDANLGILVENAAAYWAEKDAPISEVIEESETPEVKPEGAVIESEESPEWDEVSYVSTEVKRSFGGMCTGAFCIFSKKVDEHTES